MTTLDVLGSAEVDRVEALTRIGKIVLDIRIVCCVLAAVWALTEPGFLVIGCLLVLFSGWQVAGLAWWQTLGRILAMHPVLLCVDMVLSFVALSLTAPLSPMLLVPASGAVLVGLCLDRVGALVFSPVMLIGWLAAVAVQPDQIAYDRYLGLVVVPVLLLAMLFIGAGIRRIVLVASQSESDRLRQVRLSGVAEERARLAREMHDSLAKTLHGITMLTDSLQPLIDRDPTRAKAQAGLISESLSRANTESRAMLLSMRRATSVEEIGSQVEHAVTRWQQTSNRQARVWADPAARVATDSGYEMIAILNEALENIVRHTPAQTSVQVSLGSADQWVQLDVVDNGPGADFDPHQSGIRARHYGVVGMRERAVRAGGDMRFDSAPGRGTRVSVRIPSALDDMEYS